MRAAASFTAQAYLRRARDRITANDAAGAVPETRRARKAFEDASKRWPENAAIAYKSYQALKEIASLPADAADMGQPNPTSRPTAADSVTAAAAPELPIELQRAQARRRSARGGAK